MSSDLMTLQEVAEYLRVPPATLYAWRSQGRSSPRAARVGKHIRFRRSDVDAWLDQQICDTRSPAR